MLGTVLRRSDRPVASRLSVLAAASLTLARRGMHLVSPGARCAALAAAAGLLMPACLQAGTVTAGYANAPAGFMSVRHTVTTGLTGAAVLGMDANGDLYLKEGGAVHKLTAASGFQTDTSIFTYDAAATVYATRIDGNGDIFIGQSTGSFPNQAVSVKKETLTAGSYVESTVMSGTYSTLATIAVSKDGNTVFVGGSTMQFPGFQVGVWTANGNGYSRTATAASGLSSVNALVADNAGVLYIAGNGFIQQATPNNGAYSSQQIASGMYTPLAITVDSYGTLYAPIAGDTQQTILSKFSPSTNPRASVAFDVGLSGVGGGLAVTSGVHPQVFISDGSNLYQYGIEAGDFGTLPVGTASGTYRVNFAFQTATTLDASHPVVLTGVAAGNANANDFKLVANGATCSGTYAARATCSVDVAFTGTRPGTRNAAVALYTQTSYATYTAPLTALTTGPEIGFDPVQTNLTNLNTPSVTFGPLATDQGGSLFGYVGSDQQIKKFNPSVGPVAGGDTIVASSLTSTTGLSVGGNGNVFYVDGGTLKNALPSFDGGSYTNTSVPSAATPASLTAVAADGFGNLFLTSASNGFVYRGVRDISNSYVYTNIGTVANASAIVVGPYGDVFVSQGTNSKISRLAPMADGTYTASVALDLTGGGNLGGASIVALAVDNANTLYYSLAVAEGVKVAPQGYADWTTTGNVGSKINIAGVAVTGAGVVFAASNSSDIFQYDPTTSATITFNNTTVGRTSYDSPRRVFVYNRGNAALVFPVAGSGLTNPRVTNTDFKLSAGTSGTPCNILTDSPGAPYRLPATAACDVNVSFQPSVAAAIQGNLIFTQNSLNVSSPYAQALVNLAGTGLEAPAKLQFSPVPAGPVIAGNSLGSVTVQEARADGTLVTTATDRITLIVTESDGNVIYNQEQPAVNGAATFDASATLTRTGTAVVKATVMTMAASGTLPTDASANVTVTAGPVYTLTAVAQTTPQTTTVNTGFGLSLAVTANDQYGNLVPGATVNFTAPGSGASASLSPASPTTAGNGVASSGATANGVAGSYVVTATSNGHTASFNLTNSAAVAIAVAPSSLANGVVGVTSSQSLSASGGTNPYTFAVTAGALPGGLTLSGAGVLSGKPTTAGTFNFTVTATDSNSNSGSRAYMVIIAQGTTTVTLNTSTVTYDGAGHAVTATTSPAGLTVNITYTNGGVTTATAPVNAGTYSISATVSDANYTGSAAGSFTITKAAATITLNTPTATYDSNGHGATASTNPNNLPVSLTYTRNGVTSAAVPVNAGTYAVAATVTDPNYTGSASGSLIINQATATVNLTAPTATYDKATHGATAVTSPAGLTVDITYAKGGVTNAFAPTDAGTYSVTGTVNNPNYTGTATATLTINQAAVTITLGSLTATYDSAQHPATATTDPAGVAVIFTYSKDGVTTAAAPVNAGTYTVVGTVNNPNYTGSATATLTIGKATLTVALDSLDATYDGNAHYATATTSPAHVPVTFTYNNGSVSQPIARGTYSVTGTVNDPNYSGSQTGTLTINPGKATVAVTAPNATYDGNPHGATATTTPANLALSITYNVGGNITASAPTNAGTYVVTATVTDPNYTGGQATSYTINKAEAKIAFGSNSVVYDGQAHAISTVTNPAGLPVSVTYGINGVYSATPPTNVGVYSTIAEVNTTNYAGNSSIDFDINPGKGNVTLGSLAAIYDGAQHAATATTSPSGLNVTFTYTRNGVTTSVAPKDAGAYTVVGTIQSGNYSGSATGTLTIGTATATVTLGSLSAIYDGNVHAATATTNPSNLAVTFTYNGQPTAPKNAGTYTVVGTVSDPNYTGSASGTLAIGQGTATITLGSLTSTYDGQPHAATTTTTPANLAVNLTYNGSSSVPVAAGLYTVAASVTDPNYAGFTNGTLTISKASPAIVFYVLNHAYGDAPFKLEASSNSDGAITYSVVSGPATVSGSTVTLTGAGSITLRASVAATTNFSAGTADTTFTVSKTTQTVTFAPTLTGTFGQAPVVLSATSSSNLPVVLSVVSGPGSLSGNTLSVTGAGSIVVRASQAGDNNNGSVQTDRTIVVAKATPAVVWPAPVAVPVGTVLSATQLNATATGVGGVQLPGTFLYTPAAGTALNTPGSVTLAVTFAPTDSANYNGTQASTAVTVVAAASTVSVTSSLNPSPQGVAVPITVVVSASGLVPAGSVVVSENGVTLTTLTLNAGSATWSPTSLSAGSHSLLFSYTGSPTATASSATFSQAITAFAVTVGGGNQSVSVTANSGDTATVNLSVIDSSNFSGTVTFSCSGLPANASCVFNPPSITLVPGGQAQAVTLTIVTQNNASLTSPKFFEGGSDTSIRFATIFLFPAVLLGGLSVRARRLRRGGFSLLSCMVVLLAASGMGMLTGCGSSPSSASTKKVTAGTYNISVVATTSTSSVTLPVTFVVK